MLVLFVLVDLKSNEKKTLKPIKIFHLKKKNKINFNNATFSKENVYSFFNNII